MGKATICIGKNEDTGQLRSAAKLIGAFVFATGIEQFLYFLNPKFPAVTVQAGLCQTWSEHQIVGFLTHRLKYFTHA